MGLMLFPGDGDVTSPHVEWSHSGFALFRRWLAQIEGFELDEMDGFGGERPWSGVHTTLEPLLNHPDDHGELTPAHCAAVLPRLEEIHDHHVSDAGDPDVRQHFEDVGRLITVLRICVAKDAELYFG
ncbi:hypothetical protein G3I18_15220 [Actinospica acidiphila]|uniref:Uncharacterized protein n=1 Tax=Actinospica acidiphila TaxID=304899 RepID=A0A9X5CK40_9ACTN|nr:hypothetical protein [Actinospica acidiphila]NEC49920.1 hypothetical protein [Actinospica acidiphila]